jgi:hypothetical protein
LSYAGAEFETIECQLPIYEKSDVVVSSESVYDTAAALWQLMYQDLIWGITCGIIQYPSTEENNNTSEALRVSPEEDPLAAAKRYFWGANQRFFRSLCVAFKVPTAISLTRVALGEGHAVVIGLQSTGEAAGKASQEHLNEFSEDELISSPAMVLHTLVRKLFPIPKDQNSLKNSSARAASFQPPPPGSVRGTSGARTSESVFCTPSGSLGSRIQSLKCQNGATPSTPVIILDDSEDSEDEVEFLHETNRSFDHVISLVDESDEEENDGMDEGRGEMKRGEVEMREGS